MLKLSFIALTVTACVHLPHVDSKPRTSAGQYAAAVWVETSCAEPNPLDPGIHQPLQHMEYPMIDWGGGRGTGVVISERHILTALHVVQCPLIPTVKVHLADGRTTYALVTREDEDNDIALLEVASAQNLELYIAPPVLVQPADFSGRWCARATTGARCGDFMYPQNGRAIFGGVTSKGWSGAGVYDEQGRLTGIVLGGNGTSTEVGFVDASWLKGT